MNILLKKAGLGMALAATALTAAAPADAQRYGGYRHRGHGDTAGAAVLGGILGLGIGAAIASSNRDRYYDRGYYNDGYYADRGYYYSPPPRVIYRERYYAPAPRYYDRGYYYGPGPRYRGYYGY